MVVSGHQSFGTMITTTLIGIIFVGAVVSGEYHNKPGENFTFTCPDGKGLGSLSSVYIIKYRDGTYNDRQFQFKCDSDVGAYNNATDCFWTNYMNWYHQNSSKTICPLITVPTGVRSNYSRGHFDRLWYYRCCIVEEQFSDCYWNDCFLNDYRASHNYTMPFDRIVKSYFTYYVSYDRRWKVRLCRNPRVKTEEQKAWPGTAKELKDLIRLMRAQHGLPQK